MLRPPPPTLKRALPSKADVLNTLHPNKGRLCQEDLPNILLSYFFSDHTLHVVFGGPSRRSNQRSRLHRYC